MATISVFSASHCHGESVAEAVAQKLGCERIEMRLLADASERFGIPEEKLIRAMTGPAPLWNRFTHEREKSIACLRAALADLLVEDGRLIHGYAGHLVPNSISHVLRVCVVANFPYRVRQAAQAHGKSEKEAAKIVHEDDEECLQWTQYLLGKPPYEEELYDLVVPMQGSSVEAAASLICDTAGTAPLETTALSQLAARDFQLAARVGLALVVANHDVEVKAEQGEVTIYLNRPVLRMEHYREELTRIALETAGVGGVKVDLGPRCRLPEMNPWANLEPPPKILLVDDEKEFVQTLSERLKRRNLESAVAYSGEQALEFMETGQTDVMVLDLMMPGIGGIEALRRLKRTHPNTEVIILTGHGSEREEQLAAELGAFAYLEKPVNIDALAQVMRDAYGKVRETKPGTERESGGAK